MKINYSHPANQKYLELTIPQKKTVLGFENLGTCDPKSIENVYSKVGMHEEVVKGFWDVITKKLPVDCRWLIEGRPVLVNPNNGVIFGFKAGNFICALRVSEKIKKEALKNGAITSWKFSNGEELQAHDFGDDWILFHEYSDKQVDWCLDAYNFAESS